MQEKLERLRQVFRSKGRTLTALSGGVDSTLCQKLAHDTLGFENAVCVTARSETLTTGEFEEIRRLAAAQGWNHRVIEYSELEIPNYAENPVNRCYFCKQELFTRLTEVARELGCACVVEGTNHDDRGDYRPGMRAASEIGTFAPLLECEVTKEEVREMAREFGLPNFGKPSGACLSSRFPYGTRITREGLDRVAASEDYLRGIGFTQVRVRSHGDLARIEVVPGELARFLENGLFSEVSGRLRAEGFTYVTLDLTGYRTGSLNEAILKDGKAPLAAE
jgi:uncharacterized protein